MYSMPGPLFSKALSFRLHRLSHYTFKVLPCLKGRVDMVQPVRIFSLIKKIEMYNKILLS